MSGAAQEPGPERQLRDEVRYLGDRLGDTLRASAGAWLFDLVEEVRRLAKGARGGVDEDAARLRALLSALDIERAHPLSRAFAHFLALANVAESRHRARAQVTHGTREADLRAVLERVVASGVAPERLFEQACRQPIELVLTAHPTQASRRTVLAKYARIAEALARRATNDPEVEAAVDGDVRREITSLWHTDDLRRLRPTPIDEARTWLALFERILWDAVPAFLRRWDAALAAVTGRSLPISVTPIRFGSWVGGDRDGNPFVTADVTREALLLARWQAADLFARELDALGGELSIGTATDELRALAGGATEPYRKILRDLGARVRDTRRACESALGLHGDARTLYVDAEHLVSAGEIASALDAIDASLVASGLEIIARGRLLDIRRRVAIFGVTLAPLDIRQHAGVHSRALDELTTALGLGSYAAWGEDERLRFLTTELASKRPLLPRELPPGDALANVVSTLTACAEQTAGTLGAYVISGAATVSDILAVHLLQREVGVRPPLRVVPLFETLADLEAAPRVVGALLDLPVARALVGDALEVMIGYSDSAKDAGRVASAWALFEAQESLLRLAAERGIKLTLFHGRGGTIGRGGGPIALSIRSQPAGSVANGLRVTVQGESIDAAFGLPEIAEHTFELYVGAVLESTLRPPQPPQASFREAMAALARRSAEVYRDTLEDPRFYPYFQTATPEGELGLLNIGSRPAKRSASGGLGALRAIPWQFAWTQNRLVLPAWLGAHAALEPETESEAQTLRTMMTEWPFFTALIDLLEMVVAKGDLPTAEYYDELLVPEALQPLGAELISLFDRTRRAILALRGESELLGQNPTLDFSIRVRNPYLYPLGLLQAELLRRLRAAGDGDKDERVVDALLITIHGVAAGMRNTG